MNFNEREKKIFFDIISDLTGHHNNTGVIEIGLTEAHIIKRVSEKITRKRAVELLEEFRKEDIHYLDGEKEWVYRISAAGRVLYWEHLKQEAYKTELDQQSVKSTIKTGLYTRRNIWIMGTIAFIGLLFVILNFILGLMREVGESQKEERQLLQQIEELRNNQKPSTTEIRTGFPFSDTSLPIQKVKMEK